MIARNWPREARQGIRRWPMRWVVSALLILGFAPAAFAGDFDTLRGTDTVGPAAFNRWSGFYIGGQYGYSSTSTDFSGATKPLVAFSLRELALESEDSPSAWPVLGRTTNRTSGFGGFAGYNTQWQDLILSIEGNYNHTSFTALATATPIARIVSAGGNTYSVNLTGTGELHLIDYGSLRARAGVIYGNFLPYGFAGFVVGRGDYNITSLVFGQQNPSSPAIVPCDTVVAPTCVDYSFSNSASQNTLLYGFSVGAGIDYALTPNVFLRGEFEYVQFAPVANIVASIISGHVGAGLKF
jgi:outer membrane immunogenic protein